MSTRRRRLVEAPTGQGRVYGDGAEIAKVRYELRVVQDMISLRAVGGHAEELPGLTDAAGRVWVLDGQRDLLGRTLILELADGRQIDFLARSGDPISGSYAILRSGGFRTPGQEE